MNLPARVLAATLRRARRLPRATLTRRPFDYAPHRKRETEPAVLANRAGFLPGGGARPSPTEFERLMGTNDLVDEFYLERALLAASPVCRLDIRAPSGQQRGYATGFMVSPRLLLTNEHVFGSADEAEPSIAEFNYRLDIAGRPEPSYRFRLRPDIYFFNDEPLDFSLVAVEPQSLDDGVTLDTFGYHRLIAESGKALLKEWMTIIQHPGGNRRQFAIRENECVEDEDPDVIWYMSDTAQGSSGSPVFNDSLQVVALHHAGVARQDPQKTHYILKNGKKVTDLRDVDDSEVDWIANAGIRVSRICARIQQAPEHKGCLAELKAAMQGGDVLSRSYQESGTASGATMNPRLSISPSSNVPRLVLGNLVLELTGTVAGPTVITPFSAALPAGASSDITEGLKEPIIDTNYASRTGFDTRFLGIDTPLPRVSNDNLVTPMKDGRKVIPYEHFSVVLHKTRKLPIFTASNVDGSAKAKRPEAGKSYTRKALTGLNDNQQEKWVLDPRVDESFQIPDGFYTRDNGAFDKGHVVRREDVCFGRSFAQIQRANGDTFHVTNCSPQRGNFNQSGRGGIWGSLENFIGAQADMERYCLFAGPVLSPSDKAFDGIERVKIPMRFWKVVCAVKAKKLQVFAFVLEQDIKDLPLEFQVDAEWKHKQVTLKKLESLIGLVKFSTRYHTADQA
jgi:endonuclease G, mitochondrial